MFRKTARTSRKPLRMLTGTELESVAGGADSMCETLIKLRDATSGVYATFFQAAINGSGCSGPNCHGAKSGAQHA